MKNKLLAVVGLAVSLLSAGPLFAHHSAAAYDRSKEVTLTGTVTKYQFIQPHIQIYFQVKDANGNVEEWVAPGGAPTNLRRDGWSSLTFKPGDQISVRGWIAKNGRKMIRVTGVIDKDGKVLKDGAPE